VAPDLFLSSFIHVLNGVSLAMNRAWNTAVGFVLLIVTAGCGGGTEGRKDVYPVSGTVMFQGGPVIGASVAFSPDEKQPVAMGTTNDSGQFTLTTYEMDDGAAAGPYHVIVTKFQSAKVDDSEVAHGENGAAPDHDAADEKGSKGGGNLLPTKYEQRDTSDLTFKVETSGTNNFEIVLQ